MTLAALLLPAHYVEVFAHALAGTSDAAFCPDEDDGCPPNCADCPCGQVPTAPTPPMQAVASAVVAMETPPLLVVASLVDRLSVHRLERPPRAA